jgi:hypothetical protein
LSSAERLLALSDALAPNGTNGTQPPPPDPSADHVDGERPTTAINDDAEPEGAVPPGYDWPTHGGYLGCLLGLIGACIAGGFIGSSLLAALTHYQWVPGIVAALIAVAVYAVVIVALCWLGWTLGKRYYRAYPQTRGRTWGEHDDYTEPAAEPDAMEAGDGHAGRGGHAPDATPTPGEGVEAAHSEEPAPDEPAERPSGV